MKVGIVGVGYVGSGIKRLFSSAHEVVTYDPRLTGSHQSDIQGAEITFICVPTPMAPDGTADFSLVENSVKWIGSPIIVIKSTVPPGTTDMLAVAVSKEPSLQP
jgi:UDPglucose 6-dehydrogenase